MPKSYIIYCTEDEFDMLMDAMYDVAIEHPGFTRFQTLFDRLNNKEGVIEIDE